MSEFSTNAASYISADTYNNTVIITVQDGKSIKKKKNCAIQFLLSLEWWSDKTWDSIFIVINEYLNKLGKTTWSKLVASLQVDLEVEVSEPEIFIAVSDED